MFTCPFSSIMSSSLSPLQKVDVLELVGSAFVLHCPHTACHYGIPCLNKALVLRQSIEDAGHSMDQMHCDPTCSDALEQLEEEAGDYHDISFMLLKLVNVF